MDEITGAAFPVFLSDDSRGSQSDSESSSGEFTGRRVRRLFSTSVEEVSSSATQPEQRRAGVSTGHRTLRERVLSMVRSTLRLLHPIAALRRDLSRNAAPEAAEPARARHRSSELAGLREVPAFQPPDSSRPPATDNGMPGADESSLLSAVSRRSPVHGEDSERSASPSSRASTITEDAVETVPCRGLARPADVQADRVLQLLESAQARSLNLDEAHEFQSLTELDCHYIPPDLLQELQGATASAKLLDSKLERAMLLLAGASRAGSSQHRQELLELQRETKAILGPLLLRCLDWHGLAEQGDSPSPAGELLSRFFRKRLFDRGGVLVEQLFPQIGQIATAETVTPGALRDLDHPDGAYANPRNPGISRPALSERGSTDPGAAPSISATSPAMAQANGVELAYSDTGGNAPAIVLIRGLGTQMTEWSPALIEGLRQQGLRVITFDNRDSGLSSKLEGDYALSAMAEDVAGLLDFLSVDSAHIFGISLGGMVAQLLAHHHPRRVLSLCSVMSSSGSPDLPPMTDDVKAALFRQVEGREAIVRLDAENRQLFGSPGYPESEQTRLAAARAAYDRCYCPQGVGRQITAAMLDGSRVERLKTIGAPTLVIHGAADRLFSPACGKDTANCIRDAELAIVDGMGHNIPDALAPIIVDLVSDFIGRRADASANR